MSKQNLKFFYPNFFTKKLIAYVIMSLAENMRSNDLEVSVMGIASTKDARQAFYKDAIPPFLWRIVCRIFSSENIGRFAEYRFKTIAKRDDIVYLWPGSSIALFKDLKNKGCIIVRENINTHTGHAKKLLETEYRRLGIKEYNNISNETILAEIEIQKYTDFIFSPSPIVTQSIKEYGVPPESIIPTSYGLKKSDILSNTIRSYKDNDYVTLIFVGHIGVRKGIHLLLDAWTKANIYGRLILVGKIDDEVKDLVNNNLSENISHIPFVDDLSEIFAKADIFILPSLEEGSPLVTYLALGAGLPSIVSPMGGGGIVSDAEGIVIEPHDTAGWIDAIKTLASNGELRKTMGINAHQKSNEYTWDNVAKKRAEALKEKLQTRY